MENTTMLLNVIWTMLAAILVYFMQAGFALVETGFTRAKNAGNICMKNLMDFVLGSLFFFILGFCIGMRWLFLWHLTPYARFQILKIALVFIMLPTFFYGIYAFSDFKNFLDEVGIQEILNDIPEREQISMAIYIRSQMIFFAISCLIGIILIPFKLIWNIWKQHNIGEV